MDALPRNFLVDAYHELKHLVTNQLTPEQALPRFHALQGAYAAVRMELIWQHDSFPDSYHYDIIVHDGDEGIASLAFCKNPSLPWPLRGAQRFKDSYVFSIDGRPTDIATTLASLEFVWTDAMVLAGLVNGALVQRAVEKLGL